MLILFSLACLLIPASFQETTETTQPTEFVLTSTPSTEVTTRLTKDVKLRCAGNETSQSELREILVIRIEKQSSDLSWKPVASIQGKSEFVSAEVPTLLAEGFIGQPVTDSYLQVTWSLAKDDTPGVYKCNVVGMDAALNVITEQTPLLEIKEKTLSISTLFDLLLREQQRREASFNYLNQEVLEIAQQFNVSDDMDKKINDVDEELKLFVEDKLNEYTARTNTEVKSLSENVTDKINSEISATEEKISNFDENFDKLSSDLEHLNHLFQSDWPKGDFALLKPKDGCPKDPAFAFGEEGVYQIFTEDDEVDSPQTKFSEGIHLSKPFLLKKDGRNRLYLRYCTAALYEMRTAHWPSGSYCFLQDEASEACPGATEWGHIRIDGEDTSERFEEEGDEDIYFCCVRSASAYDAIRLPSRSPFYLFRMGGACQKVISMDYYEEYIEIDTNNMYNLDTLEGVHPDATINSEIGKLRLELCYYY